MKNRFKLFGLISLILVVGFSIAACATTGGGVPLAAPQNVTAAESAVTPPWRSITVTWAAVEGADRYMVYQISADGSSTGTEAKGTSYIFNHHFPGREFSYEVTALRGRRDVSPKSARVSVRTSPETQADITARAEEAARAAAASAARTAAAEEAARVEAARIAAIENTPQFQQLRGSWRKGRDTIRFPERISHDCYIDVVGATRSGKITTFASNSVTVDTGGGRLGIVTFNYAISGNSLTVSNFTMGGQPIADMNGVYTKQ